MVEDAGPILAFFEAGPESSISKVESMLELVDPNLRFLVDDAAEVAGVLRVEATVADAMRNSWDVEFNPAIASATPNGLLSNFSSSSVFCFPPLARALPVSPRRALPAAICSAFLSFRALLFSVRYIW